MRIFITGHQGFIGQHLVERLIDQHDLIYLEGDLRDHDNVCAQVTRAQPQMILHLAARTEVERSFYEQAEFSDINYTSTVNLVESARQCRDLENFVFASTMEVYGWQPISDAIQQGMNPEIFPFSERTQANPNAPYAVAKYACEKYLEYAHRAYRLPYTILRQTNCYGRKDNDFFVVEQIITQMLENSQEINLGNPASYRNFIYIDDLIDVWTTVVEKSQYTKNKIYTLGPNNAIQISALVDIIAKKLDWHGTINWNTKPQRPGEIYLLNSDANKIYSDLGWQPQIDLDTGLDMTIAYWKKRLQQNQQLAGVDN